MKPITCLQGAQVLVQLAKAEGEGLTNLQIQKILYFANMLHIGKYGPDTPLVEEKFLTWIYGPAVDLLYERLRKYKGTFVKTEAFDDIVSIMNKDTHGPKKERYESHVEILKDAYKRWGKFDSYKLVGISHWRKGAWENSVRNKKREIDNVLIEDEFKARYEHAG